MPEKQSDFFKQLENTPDITGGEAETETALKLKSIKQVKKRRLCQSKFNPPSGRLGGWASHYDNNLNDPNLEKRWKN